MGVQYIGDNGPDGVSIGKSSTELVSFYGETPVAQAAAITAATNTTTTTTTTTALTTDIDSIRTKLNSVITALTNIGILA
jgi:hypothetical protein